jgi:drug/metabolite transporter (DMT)-like permease
MTPSRPLEYRGLWLGFIGVAIFSLTLPFTRMAVAELDASFVALGRAVLAAVLAVGLLAARGAFNQDRRPRGRQWQRLAGTALGVIVGFPLASSWAMRDLPAAHAGVVIGLLPLGTATFGALLTAERPSIAFWLCAIAGSGLVVVFALWEGGGALQAADWMLFAAVVFGAFGYAQGAQLSRELGGPETISWALVIALPILLPVVAWLIWRNAPSIAAASWSAWVGMAYVTVFSMFVGFLFWYRGLALGGIARVSQIQLLQPFLTLAGGWLLLGEAFDGVTILFALGVIAVVAIGRRAPVAHAPDAIARNSYYNKSPTQDVERK